MPVLFQRFALLLLSIFALTAQVVPDRAGTGDRANDSTGTLVYDARLREFRCWSEGALLQNSRQHLCDPAAGWHPVNANLYLVNGQSVNVLVMNGVAEDIFSLDVKADDLAEPTVPISGALSELPKLQSIPPAPTVLAGLNTQFVSGPAPIMASSIYRMLITLEDKDFKAWFSPTLIDPLSAKEVTDLLAVDLPTAIAQATPSAEMIAGLTSVNAALSGIHNPSGMDDWVTQVRSLVLLLDREAALRSQLVASGVAAAGKTISDAYAASRASPIQKAAAINVQDFQQTANNFAAGFGQNPYARITAITVGANGNFQSAGMEAILNPINEARASLSASTILARLQANLTTVADNAPAFQLAEQRREGLENELTTLAGQYSSTSGVFALQTAWNQSANLTISAAAMLNNAAKTLPLEPAFDVLPAGQWFSNKTITLTVKQGQRVALFDVAGLSDATRTGVTGGDTPAAKSTQVAATDLAAARVIQFPIYTLYHLKLGLGFVYSFAPDNRYQVDKVTTGSGSSATTQQFIDQTRARDYNILATVNLVVFPWARHAFPWRPRFDGEPRPPFYKDLGAMVGFSVTSPNRDFLLGGSWFPRSSPVGIQLGWHIALRDYPPDDVKDLTQPVTGRIINLQLKRLDGLAVGLVFTTDFFGKVFAPVFKP